MKIHKAMVWLTGVLDIERLGQYLYVSKRSKRTLMLYSKEPGSMNTLLQIERALGLLGMHNVAIRRREVKPTKYRYILAVGRATSAPPTVESLGEAMLIYTLVVKLRTKA